MIFGTFFMEFPVKRLRGPLFGRGWLDVSPRLQFPNMPMCRLHNVPRTAGFGEDPIPENAMQVLKYLKAQLWAVEQDCRAARFTLNGGLNANLTEDLEELFTSIARLDAQAAKHKANVAKAQATCTCERDATCIEDLPPELLVCIFSFLDVCTLYRSRRVCRLWNSLTRSGSLKKVIHVDALNFPIHWEDKDVPANYNSSCLKRMFNACLGPKVEHVIFSSGWNPRCMPNPFYDMFESDERPTSFNKLFAKCPDLREVTFHGFSLRATETQRMPTKLRRLRLHDVLMEGMIDEMKTDGPESFCKVHVKKACVDMGEERKKNLWSVLDRFAAPLGEDNEMKLLKNLWQDQPENKPYCVALLQQREPGFGFRKVELGKITLKMVQAFKPWTKRQLLEWTSGPEEREAFA